MFKVVTCNTFFIFHCNSVETCIIIEPGNKQINMNCGFKGPFNQDCFIHQVVGL